MKTKEEKAIRKVVISALVGASLEWYDFFLYGVVAGIVFNKLYFPTSDIAVSTMLAYATFAVGFVTRPLGASIGDQLAQNDPKYGGWGLGTTKTSAIFLTAILILVVYLVRTKKDQILLVSEIDGATSIS